MAGPVVVGLDGSPASVTAAWWAAHEAVVRHLPVLLLHSWTTQPLDVPVAQEALSKQRHGGRVLQRTEAELLHRHAGLSMVTELVSEPASKALVDAGETATLLVLGSRGHGSVAGFLLGSVSLHVLGLAQCPSVTVRAGDPAVAHGWSHPAAIDRQEVVVGVQQPAPTADALLEFAFTAAEAHGVRVRAVRALPPSSLVTHPHAPSPGDGYEADERTRLAADLAPWQEKFPGVEVVDHVARGSASQVLLAASARSRLTVVGRRRHPSPLTWKLGPVAHAALHHLPCPVAVVTHD
ncbi:universal stress protein [Streptomyces sp. TLI_185]|uniref:universal stress protein n=1 Tax=Streptomyces sp. TLI_185 TaxID=2485151 RepID=UPI000F4DECFE|nr:universal stress protein [Streptomyces sp. TLI_185]RPF30869.1 nucleotide-binding universal stress UspA family protein [Streptomyces sp. TLI_185]